MWAMLPTHGQQEQVGLPIKSCHLAYPGTLGLNNTSPTPTNEGLGGWPFSNGDICLGLGQLSECTADPFKTLYSLQCAFLGNECRSYSSETLPWADEFAEDLLAETRKDRAPYPHNPWAQLYEASPADYTRLAFSSVPLIRPSRLARYCLGATHHYLLKSSRLFGFSWSHAV